jgi:regulator of extracellular matrix RemA (YlzA/DUF370 family)
MCLRTEPSSRSSFVSLILRRLTRQVGHVVIRLSFRFRREETSQLSPDRLDLVAVGFGRVLAGNRTLVHESPMERAVSELSRPVDFLFEATGRRMICSWINESRDTDALSLTPRLQKDGGTK